jgi:hypothetical protein
MRDFKCAMTTAAMSWHRAGRCAIFVNGEKYMSDNIGGRLGSIVAAVATGVSRVTRVTRMTRGRDDGPRSAREWLLAILLPMICGLLIVIAKRLATA